METDDQITYKCNSQVIKYLKADLKMGQDKFCIFKNIKDLNKNSTFLIPEEEKIRNLAFVSSNISEFYREPLEDSFERIDTVIAERLGIKVFNIPTNTVNLHIGANGIELINVEAGATYKLKNLLAFDNRIKSISTFQNAHFQDLEYIILQNNLLGTIDFKIFETMKKLVKIDIKGNGLNYLVNSMNNTSLPSLKYLDLENNSLCFLDLEALKPFPSLETLKLSKNYLAELNYKGIPAYFPHIKRLVVRENLWICDHLVEMIIYFQKNDVDYVKDVNCGDGHFFDNVCCYSEEDLAVKTKSDCIRPQK